MGCLVSPARSVLFSIYFGEDGEFRTLLGFTELTFGFLSPQ